MSAKAKQSTRMRKVHCSGCGFTVRMTRQWIAVGLPSCPNPECALHGWPLTCADAADQIIAEPELLDTLPRRERTAVCRANGWTDAIVRTSVSQEPGRSRRRPMKVAADLPF